MRKKKIFIILLIIAIIAITIFITSTIKQRNEFIELSKKEYSENIKNPDRIIYKPSEEDEYYEILPDEELYNSIIKKVSESIGELNESLEIPQDEIDKLHQENSYIEFDYNTISKNFIIPFDASNKGVIKLKEEGANLLNSKVKNVNSIKRMIDKDIKENDRKKYTMNTNKEYVSTNVFNVFPYRYRQQFKEIDYMIYQAVITNWEDYELYKEMCELKFDEPLPEDIFDNNVLVLTISTTDNVTAKASIGNIKYTYDTSKNVTYGYRAHLFAVSKIVNTNCIYNTNVILKKLEEANDIFEKEYDNKVENIDKNIFVTDFEEYMSNAHPDTLISQSKAEEIADKAFEEASRIAGEYDKQTQVMKKESIYANNFFTAKIGQSPKNYGTSKIQAYVFTREDEMGNGISVYIDVRTAKVIGGKAFGD